MNRRIVAGFLVAGLLPLAGKEEPRFGLQVGLVDPQGDLKDGVDSKKGLTAGLHCTFDLGNGCALRPRIDYLRFPTREHTAAFSSGGYSYASRDSFQVTHTSVGLDFLVHPMTDRKAFYLLGGVSYMAWKGSSDFSDTWSDAISGVTQTEAYSETRTWNKAGFTVGVGHELGRRGLVELRYTLSKIGDEDASANFLTLGMGFRF